MDGMSVYFIDNTLFLEKKKKIMWLIGQENQNLSLIHILNSRICTYKNRQKYMYIFARNAN